MVIRITGFRSVVKNFFNKLFAHAVNVEFVATQPAKPFAGTQEPRAIPHIDALKHWPMLFDTVLGAPRGVQRRANHYRFHCYNIPHKSSVVKRYFQNVVHTEGNRNPQETVLRTLSWGQGTGKGDKCRHCPLIVKLDCRTGCRARMWFALSLL